MQATCDFGETVAIEPRHVRALLQTFLDGGAASRQDALSAAHQVATVAHGQDPDAVAWILPAEPLGRLAELMYAAGVYDLDETEETTYDHPGVWAEHWVFHQVRQQAPRTAAALDALHDAETVVLLAQA